MLTHLNGYGAAKKMIVNICASGSSGSTLLSHILNRHPDIFSGRELGLFSKNILFENFDLIKKRKYLVKMFGISSRPYFDERSIFRNLKSFNLNREEVWKLLEYSKNLNDFVYSLKKIILEKQTKEKIIWAEKTPENIFLIKYFLKCFPSEKIIHIVRDPRDVIISLMGRGISLLYAAETWLSSVASIQPFVNNTNVLEVKYEELVRASDQVIKSICIFLGIPFYDDMLNENENEHKKNDYFTSWKNTPGSKISTGSLNRYKNSDIKFNNIFKMRISDEFATLQGIKRYTIIELMEKYDYKIEDFDNNDCNNYVKYKQNDFIYKKDLKYNIKNFIEKILLNEKRNISKVDICNE